MLTCVWLIVGLVNGCQGKASLKNGGFDEILLVLDETSEEADLSYLASPDVATFFHEVSRVLFVATKGQTYFREIQILIPPSWRHKPEYAVAGEQSMKLADFVVAEPNPTYGDQPYVLQPGECGDPGHFIHLTPSFLKNGVGTVTSGQQAAMRVEAKTVVQQWVKYRYGVFDESVPYPESAEDAVKSIYRPFYPEGDDNKFSFVPTVCGSLSGHMAHEDGSECKKDNNWIDHECRFVADKKQSVNASLMYTANLEDVVEFCEDTGHNRRALNEHNDKCDYRSIWSILLQHADFKAFQPKLADASQVPIPKISFFQPATLRRIIYVLDTSSSMIGCGLENMIQAAKGSINSLSLPVDLGIVRFASRQDEEVLLEMTVMKTPEHIRKALNHLPNSAAGMTCIKCGAKQGLKALKSNQKETRGSIMVLLTDGEEIEDYIGGFIPDLKAAGIIVNTVAVGSGASANLTEVAVKTGGRAFSVEKTCGAGVLYLGPMIQSVSTRSDAIALAQNLRFPTTSGERVKGGVFKIDSDAGSNTRIIFTFSGLNKGIDINFTTPSGIEFTITHPPKKLEGQMVLEEKNVPGLTIAKEDGMYVLRFDTIEVGQWSFDIYKAGDSVAANMNNGSIVIIQNNDKHTITLDAYVSDLPLDLSVSNRLVIYASLYKGSLPVLDANVQASVYRETDVINLTLKDDGKGADNRANDGVYSAYFIDFERSREEKRYSLNVIATSTGLTGYPSKPGHPRRSTGSFRREKQTLISVVNANAARLPPQPPSRISDFRVSGFNTQTREIIFEWSAPGGERDRGAAKSYEIAVSKRLDDLAPEVSVSAERLDLGNLQPVQFGANEKLVTVIKSIQSGPIFARIRSMNQHGVHSEWSPIAQSQVPLPPQPPTPPAISIEDMAQSPIQKSAIQDTKARFFVGQEPNFDSDRSQFRIKGKINKGSLSGSKLFLSPVRASSSCEEGDCQETLMQNPEPTPESETNKIFGPPDQARIFVYPSLVTYGKVTYTMSADEYKALIKAWAVCPSENVTKYLPSEILDPELQSKAHVKFEIPAADYLALIKRYDGCE